MPMEKLGEGGLAPLRKQTYRPKPKKTGGKPQRKGRHGRK